MQHGWNITGDTYHLDADGYFWFQARADDMIVSSGYNIAGPEVEWALLASSRGARMRRRRRARCGARHIVKAFVVLKPEHTAQRCAARALQEYVKQSIAPYKYPRALDFVASLPKTPTGKLQRYVLREQEHRNAQAEKAPDA